MMSGFWTKLTFFYTVMLTLKTGCFREVRILTVIGCALHSEKCTAWIAISKNGIIEPSFFEVDHGNAVTVTNDICFSVLSNSGETSISAKTLMSKSSSSSEMAPLFTLQMSPWLGSVKSLENAFISYKAVEEWAPHSPDLNPPDFF